MTSKIIHSLPKDKRKTPYGEGIGGGGGYQLPGMFDSLLKSYVYNFRWPQKLTSLGGVLTKTAVVIEILGQKYYLCWCKGLNACLQWKVNLAYPSSLQPLHSIT